MTLPFSIKDNIKREKVNIYFLYIYTIALCKGIS